MPPPPFNTVNSKEIQKKKMTDKRPNNEQSKDEEIENMAKEK